MIALLQKLEDNLELGRAEWKTKREFVLPDDVKQQDLLGWLNTAMRHNWKIIEKTA